MNESFSIVLPCRNQADHIERVLESYFKPLDGIGMPYELIVVPNASNDGTTTIVRRFADRHACVRVVENPRVGWGRSVRAGLNAATGTILAYTNSARTDPTHVPVLLELFRRHAPCIAKIRRRRRRAPVRELGSLVYNLQGRLLFDIRAGDVNGTPKIFAHQTYRAITLSSDGDLVDLEFLAEAARFGIEVVEMPVDGFARHGGRSSTTLKSALCMYAGAIRLAARTRNGHRQRLRPPFRPAESVETSTALFP